jgi:hypothetical protein
MSKHWKYLKYILRHKWFVYQEGRRLGLGRLRLLVHDWQKFAPVEWFPYTETFYGGDSGPRRADGGYDPNAQGDAFDRAWNHHQKKGAHHWQFWVMPLDDGGVKVLEMPDTYRREMLADWCGAGRAIKGHGPERVPEETRKWYEANKNNMQLHPKTRVYVEAELRIPGGEDGS